MEKKKKKKRAAAASGCGGASELRLGGAGAAPPALSARAGRRRSEISRTNEDPFTRGVCLAGALLNISLGLL